MKFFSLQIGDVFVDASGARFVKIPVVLPGASWDPVNAIDLGTGRFARFGSLAEVTRDATAVSPLKVEDGVIVIEGLPPRRAARAAERSH